jgi:hypothetical protein
MRGTCSLSSACNSPQPFIRSNKCMTKDISKVIIPHVCITALLYLQGLLCEITGNIRCISADIRKLAVNIQGMYDFRLQR